MCWLCFLEHPVLVVCRKVVVSSFGGHRSAGPGYVGRQALGSSELDMWSPHGGGCSMCHQDQLLDPALLWAVQQPSSHYHYCDTSTCTPVPAGCSMGTCAVDGSSVITHCGDAWHCINKPEVILRLEQEAEPWAVDEPANQSLSDVHAVSGLVKTNWEKEDTQLWHSLVTENKTPTEEAAALGKSVQLSLADHLSLTVNNGGCSGRRSAGFHVCKNLCPPGDPDKTGAGEKAERPDATRRAVRPAGGRSIAPTREPNPRPPGPAGFSRTTRLHDLRKSIPPPDGKPEGPHRACALARAPQRWPHHIRAPRHAGATPRPAGARDPDRTQRWNWAVWWSQELQDEGVELNEHRVPLRGHETIWQGVMRAQRVETLNANELYLENSRF
ncbi:Zinc finger protein 717 [Galemys pyrenaicus]|uniref:Zinc finger protein 717 n=1 Tax=Galemys pyrenaicus TaxID=202257 RepID=A0A8J6AIV4_GALPY|nr:Zinc finger protein 717 [Galemys pyrenaicus]